MPVWSPDGTHLAIATLNGMKVLKYDGANYTLLTIPAFSSSDTSYYMDCVAYTPDGNYLIHSTTLTNGIRRFYLRDGDTYTLAYTGTDMVGKVAVGQE